MKLSQFYATVQIPTATDDTLGVVKPGTSMAVTAEGALNVTVDNALSDSSENPVQNKAVKIELDNKLTTPTGGTTGQVIKKTASGVEWSDDDKVTVDSSMVANSENPVQSKVIQTELDKKLTTPDNGSVGQVLKKTSSGVEWANDDKVTVDSSISDSSENPVQNKIVKQELDKKISTPDGGNVGQVLKKTANGVAWQDDLVGDSITVDTALDTSSTNPIQNAAVAAAINTKITAPSGGTVGQVLKKTSEGTEWADDNEGTTVTVDSTLSDSSENPVQNKIIKSALDEKLTTPSGGTSGQVLSKTSSGYAWVNQSGGSSSGSSITSVMFKIPTIESDEDIYHIKVEFCADDTFDTITNTFNSSTSQTAFRVFTGVAGAAFPSAGLGTQFSEEQVILDATGVTSNYYRFQWLAGTLGSDDYVAGRFGYGQLNATQSVFDDGAVSVDSVLSDSSLNPVQNRIIKSALDGKITAPDGGSSGQILSKTASGYAWVNQSSGGSGTSITSLIFKLPTIADDNTSFYHLKVEFSADGSFETITNTFNSSTSQTSFKVFTGIALANYPQYGCGSQFSGEQVTLDVSGVSSQYYRFQWLVGNDTDEELTPGRFGYGQLNALQCVFD